MLIQILRQAPVWVWPLLAGLVALGLSQRRARWLTLRRATVVPLVMAGLSWLGVVSAFGMQPAALLAWATGMAVGAVAADAGGMWPGVVWSAAERRLRVPGSWVPLVLILAIFVTKFAVGAALAIQPALQAAPMFGLAVGCAYGGFSGMFFARGVAMWKAVRQTQGLAA